MTRFIYIVSLFIVSLSSYSYALLEDMDLPSTIGVVGELLYELAHAEYARYAILIICSIVFFSQLYRAALSRVPIFGGDGGEVNKQGRIIATTLAIMTTMSFAYGSFWIGDAPFNIMDELPDGQGILLIALIAAMVFFTKKSQAQEGDFRKPLTWAALIFALGYWLYRSPVILGIFFLLVLIILASFKSGAGSPVSEGSPFGNLRVPRPNLRRWWHSVKDLTRNGSRLVSSMASSVRDRAKDISSEIQDMMEGRRYLRFINELEDYNKHEISNLLAYLRSGQGKEPGRIREHISRLKKQMQKEHDALDKMVEHLHEALRVEKKEYSEETHEEKNLEKIVNKTDQEGLQADTQEELDKDTHKLHQELEHEREYLRLEKEKLVGLHDKLRQKLNLTGHQLSEFNAMPSEPNDKRFRKKMAAILKLEKEKESLKVDEETLAEAVRILEKTRRLDEEMMHHLKKYYKDMEKMYQQSKEEEEKAEKEEKREESDENRWH